MGVRKKLVSIVCILAVIVGMAYYAKWNPTEVSEEESLFAAKDTLYFWYADDSLTDFLTNMSASYYEKTGYHVVPVLQSGLEYLEEINQASIHSDEEQMPDLYIVGNDCLEKAYLAGLAAAVKDKGAVCNKDNFSQTALDAVTYDDKYVGYPLYFETSALLYNKTYLDNAGIELPKTIDDILTFADEYDAPESVEGVFKWDVSDIFYNYYFVGNYIKIGGEAGDDPEQIDIDNEQTEQCMQIYQNLNQFFSIDTKEVNYDTVVQDFIDGKIIMTVATSDVMAKLEAAKAEGTFQYDYGITKMPDLTEALKGRSLSMTNAIVVNGYSERAAVANDFAKYLSCDHAGDLYDSTGKLSAHYGKDADENQKAFMEEYEQSISMPKMLGTSNFWVQLEICFSKVWNGADGKELLKALSEQIQTQMNVE